MKKTQAEESLDSLRLRLSPETVQTAMRKDSSSMWHAYVKRHVELSPGQEAEVWRLFSEFRSRIGPRCKFSPKGIANRFERYRRHCLCGIFHEFSLRRTDDKIRDAFLEAAQGNFSLGSFVCWAHPPPVYMVWFYEALPRHSLANLGVNMLKEIAKRGPEHAAAARSIIDRMGRHRLVERVLTT